MRLNLSADEVLTTTRSVRKRLDFDRPVEREIVIECLDIALQAPTGSNSQGWQWVFIEDADKKQQLRDIYRENFRMYRDMPRPKYEEDDPRAGRQEAVIDSADYLSENFHRAPLLLIPCLKGKPDVLAGSAGFWGSLLPAVWSFMLALRSRGLGSAWTTLHLAKETEAAELLGIPDGISQVALIPVAYTTGGDFKPATRPPVEGITYWDTWGATQE
jgi:nitroreductase